jgi:hypothetical protein
VSGPGLARASARARRLARTPTRWALALAASLWLVPALALAFVDIRVVYEGEGFDDPTPAAPVGGNTATTLGGQRRLALEQALQTWARLLDSEVPINVLASFPALGCTGQGAVLGQAHPSQWLRGPELGGSDLWYPSALADRLLGEDASPGDPDIVIELNASIDERPCRDLTGAWYYGLDGASPGNNDLIEVMLHEFAHGLGFASAIDPATGESSIPGASDAFSAHILDLDLGRTWDQLSDSERARSAGNVRRLVWDGPEAQRATERFFGLGEPRLSVEPPLVGFDGFVSDAQGAQNPAAHPARGPIVLADPIDGCAPLRNDVQGALVLLEFGPDCSWWSAAVAAAEAGAAGALVIVQGPAASPAEPLDAPPGTVRQLAIPVATVSASAASQLARELTRRTLIGRLGGDASRPLGTDAAGRPLLFATRPALQGSSVSHFDSIARPSLLMEPYGRGEATHGVDLTLAVLRDLGWQSNCGNGRIERGESCDEGPENSDAPGAVCRLGCRRAGCGDGVVEADEACDWGQANSDDTPGACRTRCQPARCGDGVRDPGEACDEGARNGEQRPDGCRGDCTLAPCDQAGPRAAGACGPSGCDETCAPPSVAAPDEPTQPEDSIEPWDDAPSAHTERPTKRAGGGCATHAGPSSAGSSLASLLVVLGLVLVRKRSLARALSATRRATR